MSDAARTLDVHGTQYVMNVVMDALNLTHCLMCASCLPCHPVDSENQCELPFSRQRKDSALKKLAQAAGDWDLPSTYDWSKTTQGNYSESDQLAYVGDFAEIRSKLDYTYHGFYSSERQLFQDRLINNIIGGGSVKEAPWVVFTAGPMGAGKGYCISWMFQQGYFPLPDFVSIDPDSIRSNLPEWNQYVANDPFSAGSNTHRESGYMVEIAQEAALRTNKNVWIDGSLRDHVWYTNVFTDIRRRYPNYRIAIIHVSASREIIFERAKSRGEKTGRFVPEETLIKSIESVPAAVQKLQPLTDFVVHIENNDVIPMISNVQKGSDVLENAKISGSELSVLGCHMSELGSWEEIAVRFVTNPYLANAELTQKVSLKLERLLSNDRLVLFSKTYCTYSYRMQRVLEAAGFLYYDIIELDKIEDGICIQQLLAKRTGASTVPQLFKGERFLGTASMFEEGKGKEPGAHTAQLARLITNDQNLTVFEEPKFDDSSDIAYLVIGSVYANGRVGRTCTYSQRVETLFAASGVNYKPILVNLADKPAWFLNSSPDGTTPLARHKGEWLLGTKTLLEAVGNRLKPQKVLLSNDKVPLAPRTVEAIDNAVDKWIKADPETKEKPVKDLSKVSRVWLDARSECIDLFETIGRSVTDQSPFLSGAEFGFDDANIFPIIFVSMIYLEGLCGFDANRDSPLLKQYEERMKLRDEVSQCFDVEAEMLRLARYHARISVLCPWHRLPPELRPRILAQLVVEKLVKKC